MTSNTSTERSKRFPGLRTIAGGVLAAGVLAITLGAAPSRNTPETPAVTARDQSAVAAWANTNGLHGFSPSSLTTDLGSLGLQTELYDPYPMQFDEVGVIPRSNFGSDIDWIEANGW